MMWGTLRAHTAYSSTVTKQGISQGRKATPLLHCITGEHAGIGDDDRVGDVAVDEHLPSGEASDVLS